jgi:ABC-type transporter Mla subunit MlaD
MVSTRGHAMASAEVIFFDHARRARDRAARLRTLSRGFDAPDVLRHIETIARELDESADQLERSATALARTVGRTADLTEEIGATIEHSKVLMRRIRQSLGELENE